jgi:ribosomal protein S18 acetylase RimI-like enzyme
VIYYSAYPDLEKVNSMFDNMTKEEKSFLYYDTDYSFVKKAELHYDIIKGKCLMLVNDKKITIGFIGISLDHNEHLFINEVYVMPEYRVQSFSILLEALTHLKKLYLRPIRFVVRVENERVKTIAKFINAKEIEIKNNNIVYVIENIRGDSNEEN